MMNDAEQMAGALMDRYLNGSASAEETQTLFDYLQAEPLLLERLLDSRMTGFSGEMAMDPESRGEMLSDMLHVIRAEKGRGQSFTSDMNSLDGSRRVHFIGRLRWAAAAVLILAAGVTYLLVSTKSGRPVNAVAQFVGDVSPGKQGARIKLSNGRSIMIDTLQDGLIAMDGSIALYKQHGTIVYKGSSKEDVAYNEIITDKGRQWMATLPDGSTVWLNAASSVRYPLHFSGKERLVEMTGEASFEVVHNASQPFRVKVGNQLVEDIGTIFNINAYSDEPAMKTTLIEGAVRQGEITLKPGEQAILLGSHIRVEKVDTAAAIAWRRGLFNFEHGDIATVIRTLQRWYNVDVRYEGAVPEGVTFSGDISKSLTLAQVLNGLDQMSVHFKIENDKTIVVTK